MLIKCIISTYSAILIYHVAQRHYGEVVARITCVFIAFNPNMIYWCGTMFKEPEMVFLCCLFVNEMEKALAEYLGFSYISLFTNGTLPLITALQALGITEGEVITTPYSFVATSHSIWWNKLKPVFVDIEESTCGMNPKKIEAAITDKTVAIMPVHCYGCPCDVEAIDAIAKRHNLKVIYDAGDLLKKPTNY